MRPAILFKILLQVCLLVAVIYAIRNLKADHVSSFFSTFGDSTVATSSGDASVKKSSYTLCPTRLHWLELANGERLEEHPAQGMKMRWTVVGERSGDINYLDVEKWLGIYCKVDAESLPATEQSELATQDCKTTGELIKIGFVDQSESWICVYPAGNVFLASAADDGAEPVMFRSQELAVGLRALKQLMGIAEP